MLFSYFVVTVPSTYYMKYVYECIYCIHKDQCWGTESIRSHLPRFSFYLFPFYLSMYLFEIPETKNSVYFIHVYGIPTLITYQTHNLCIYVYIHIYIKSVRTTLLWISTSQISGVPVHSLKTSMTCTRLYLSKG